MLGQLKYGKVKQTTHLDDNGSTITTEKNVRGGQYVKPIRKRYEIRERVTSDREEMAQMLKFYKELTDDKLDPEIKPKQHTKKGDENGYWDVLLCYTVVEY